MRIMYRKMSTNSELETYVKMIEDPNNPGTMMEDPNVTPVTVYGEQNYDTNEYEYSFSPPTINVNGTDITIKDYKDLTNNGYTERVTNEVQDMGGQDAGRRRSRKNRGAEKGKTRKGNKMLSSWVAFVKKVQHEEKISYSDAMKRASARKKEWKMGQMGGEDGSMMGMSSSKSMNKSKSQTQSQYGGNEYGAQKTAMANTNMMSAGRRRRGSKRRGSKRRGSRRSRR